MVMISMTGKARTPSDHSMGSPRYGGCVGAILHFFDWNPGKRFYSTKRLPASKRDEGLRRSRSLRSDSGSAVRSLMICDAQPQEDASIDIDEGSTTAHGTSTPMIFVSDDVAASSRAPSVVARLMGLESLPKGPYQPSSTTRHRRSRSYSGAGEVPFGFMTRVDEQPVMLQELLQRDLKPSKKTLRDRMPEFAKRAQEQYEHRFAKNGVALKVVKQDEYMPTCIDIPDVQSSTSKQPFLQRLAPATVTPPALSSFEVSMDEEGVSELGSQASTDWPLPEKVSYESSFRSERSSLLESECSSSRPASTKSSKPALANVARKIFQGRRRAATAGTYWNGSEDSESCSSQVDTDLLLIRAPREHRKPRPVAKSLSPSARRDRTMRTTATNHHEASVQEFKSSGTRIPTIPKAALQSSRTSSTIAKAEDVDDSGQADQRLPLIQSRIRSTDFQPTVVEYPSSRTPASQESTTTVSRTSTMPLTSTVSASLSKAGRPSAKSARISKSDAAVSTVVPAKLASKAPPLDGYRAPEMMRGDKKLRLPKGSLIPGYGKLLGADKVKSRKGREIQTGVVSSTQSTKNTLHGIQRVREAMLANAVPSVGDRLKLGERQDEMATPSNGADDTNGVTLGGNRKNGMVSKHARALSIDDVFPELSLDCHAPTDAAVSICADTSKLPAVSMGVLSEQVYDVDLQEFFAAGPDDLRWEEEDKQQRVHSRELSGRFCERSCSGPSVSSGSGSVGASDVDEEHNGDAWSSCASYNSGDCDFPRTFELPDTDAEECDLHEPKSLPMFVKKKTGTGGDEAAGQPSPVSILNSPFHDEAGTTSECTLNSDDDGVKSCSNSRTGEATPTSPGDAHNDKIRQALLDISMFQSFTFDYKETCTPRETEQGFVREILSAAKLMGSPNWLDQDVAIDPCLMDRLQNRDLDHAELMSGGMMWRCDRKLLIDSVKEAFVATAWQHWRCAASMPGLQRWCWSRPRGPKLVAEVYKQIEEWRLVSALSLDFLIERDMELGDWKRFGAHVADVGMDIESMVWKAVFEDEMADMVASMKLRR